MHTTHRTLILANHTVHHVTFDPTTFTDADLLWLPHHAELANAGRKRKERLFKALFPQVKTFMDFACARITRLDERTLTLALTRPQAEFKENTLFTIHWLLNNDRVITLL